MSSQPILSPLPPKSSPWLLFLSGSDMLITVGIVLLCFASSSQIMPFVSLVVACSIALLISMGIVPHLHRSPLPIILPTFILLVGTGFGCGATWIMSFGSTNTMLTAGDIVVRFGVAGLATMVTALVCPIPRLSRRLALFAIFGPTLLMIFFIWITLADREHAVWKLWGGSLMLVILLFAGWCMLLYSSHLRERIQARMGRTLMVALLRMNSARAIQQDLVLADGWIDPLNQISALVSQIATAQTLPQRKAAVQNVLDLLMQHTPFLDVSTHNQLTDLVADRPEVGSVLAVDAFHRQQLDQAIGWLEHVAQIALQQPRLAWAGDQALAVADTFMPVYPVCADIRNTLYVVNLIGVFITGKLDRKGRVDRAETLEYTRMELARQRNPLPAFVCQALRELGTQRPEALILLAEDAFRQQQDADGCQHLTRLMRVMALDSHWLVTAAQAAWDQHVSDINAQTQQMLWQAVCDPYDPDDPALASLAMIALDQGLATSIQQATAACSQPAQVLLHASHLFFGGDDYAALPGLCQHLSIIPEMFRQTRLLPRLQATAAQMSMGRDASFFTRRERPQLLETHETPLTSIYGSRISCWFFNNPKHLQAQQFIVTGHGPTPVCARVSRLLYDLAYERNCPTDMILAGFGYFDLHAPTTSRQPHIPWTKAELIQQITHRVQELQVEDAWQTFLRDPFQAMFFDQFLSRQAQPTIDATRQELQVIANEMGFVVNQQRELLAYQQAKAAIQQGITPNTSESVPVLVPYRQNTDVLQLRLPRFCLGGADYEQVTSVYYHSVRQDMQQEWERRGRMYNQWSHQFARTYRHLRQVLQHEGAAALISRTTYISAEIDPSTATEVALDPPRPMSELEYLSRIPSMLMHQLALWALADHKIATISVQETFEPHWGQNTLIDAFLRGWPLPTENEELNAARNAWQQQWQPLALATLDSCLHTVGLTLADITVENTVFRLVEDDGDYLTLELWHIFDPHYDQLPDAPSPITLFAPRFGTRDCTFQPAFVAQQHAVARMQQALSAQSVPASDMQWALLRDSGAALEVLIHTLELPLDKPDLDTDIARVLDEAQNRLDPVVAFGITRQLQQSDTFSEHLALARKIIQHSKTQQPYIPDFDAWSLYIIGKCVLAYAKNIWEHLIQDTHMLSVQSLFTSRYELPAGMTHNCIEKVATFSPWHVLEAFIENHACAGTITAILTSIDTPDISDLIRATYQRLHHFDPEYTQQCFANDQLPPPSTQRTALFAPGCFTGWKRVVYAIAEGDMALKLAWTLRRGTASPQPTILLDIMKEIQGISVPQTFERLTQFKSQVIADLQRYQMQRDRISMDSAAAALQQKVMDCCAIAESDYNQASRMDADYGTGWLRLVRLKWITSQFRAALAILTGPLPAAHLDACQLPLVIAVRIGGGALAFVHSQPLAESDIAALELTISQTNDELEIVCSAGRCCISGLNPTDRDLLATLFQKYKPGMLRSAGQHSFEEWLRLVQVPALGQRAAIAQALEGNTESVFLAACAYIGVPSGWQMCSQVNVQQRQDILLQHDVVTDITW